MCLMNCCAFVSSITPNEIGLFLPFLFGFNSGFNHVQKRAFNYERLFNNLFTGLFRHVSMVIFEEREGFEPSTSTIAGLKVSHRCGVHSN